ncbi:MAG: ABC transporter permease [Muribaculaceae bacterium]|nr:ABC transporter permease [Muribaculaceae bacterium]
MKRGPLALGIAWRYMVAPKSHGAVSAISIISVAGVAVATAAIVIVLSVFNGFRYHLNARLDTLTPDITVMPAYGKTISSGDSLAKVVGEFPGVALAMPEVADNALIIARAKEMPVKLKGVVPELYSQITSVDSLLLDGTPINAYQPGESSVSVGVAQRLGMLSPGDSLFVFAPKRIGRVNIANPASSFLSDSLHISSVFRSLQNEFDENTVICDISTARELFQYDTEATSISLKVKPGENASDVSKVIRDLLGPDFIVKDRLQQQETNFRMVEIEKWITFILLVFILLIASFNIISTLCMIILDKGNSIHTLSFLGLTKGRIGRIFWWESWLVTFWGAFIGLALGLVISLIQEKFSLLKLAGDPESLVMQAYPVKVEWLDLCITLIPVAAIGLVTAWISDLFARSRLKKSLN